MKKILILIFSLVGFSFSLYLYLNKPNEQLCVFNSCNNVLSSKFSKTAGIDNSLLGIFYFLITGFLAYFSKETFLKIFSVVGVFFAFYFVFVMFFILKEICYFCLIIDFCAIIIFILIYDFQRKFMIFIENFKKKF